MTEPAATFRTVIATAAQSLADAGISTARLEAEVLLATACDSDRTRLYIDFDRDVPDPALIRFHSLLNRRLRREPLQYILGTREFWSLEFIVTPDVLIPRPETEGVIEAVLERFGSRVPVRLCDIGTGSGCIAVTIAHELPLARIWALDRSMPALQIARLNSQRYAVEERIHFCCADLLSACRGQKFDLLVSNPPYAASDSLAGLEPELAWEPRTALDGGVRGLEVIRRLLAIAPQFIHPGGWLVMEIGFDQEHEIGELCRAGDWRSWNIERDYQGHPRVVVAQA